MGQPAGRLQGQLRRQMIRPVANDADADDLMVTGGDVVAQEANVPDILDFTIPVDKEVVGNPWPAKGVTMVFSDALSRAVDIDRRVVQDDVFDLR